ncbi:MAG TPA: two-component system VirA-like sensor kinase [Acetobacteraceae bacterium]|nr:two-component system VirA-like sensor kinase [Acetobacteraceae bacterium]
MSRAMTLGLVAALVALLSWLAIRAANPEAETFDRALTALDQLAIADNVVERDVLQARAGNLRNYDGLVRAVDAQDLWLDRLRRIVGDGPEAASAIERIAGALARQHALVERFKSDNALLQNSLAYFSMFSGALPATAKPVGPQVSALAAAMLRLTLDTSADVVESVRDRLGALRDVTEGVPDAYDVDALLAHGTLLERLLPTTDRTVRAIGAPELHAALRSLRETLLDRQAASRDVARNFRIVLYLASLGLLCLLLRVGVELRARAKALRSRAALEHLLARMSMHFVASGRGALDAAIAAALRELAEFLGADRAYFVLRGAVNRRQVWCRPGVELAEDWPDRAAALAARFEPGSQGLVHVPSVSRLRSPALRRACEDAGLKAWACVSTIGADGSGAMLGFDALQCSFSPLGPGRLSLLRTALDTVVGAVARDRAEAERARLEARLHRARRMESVGALASGITHNLNNIVAAILGFVEIAEVQSVADEQVSDTLAQIRQAGARASDLIEQILSFARPRDGRRRAVDLGPVVMEAASLLRVSLPPRVTLVVDEIAEGAVILGDATQIQQIILNIGRNGMHAIDGPGRIELSSTVDEVRHPRTASHGHIDPGRYARLRIRDTGRGMNSSTLERIFEPFFTTRRDGNGLGLATVREIIREHGGAVDVQSQPGRGSCFEIWLPCLRTGAEPSNLHPAGLPLGQGQTLMVVDYDRERLLGDEELLAAIGYEAVGFTGLADASAACRNGSGRFDAIVLVSMLWSEAAIELARSLHRLTPQVPIVLSTAAVDEIDGHSLMTAGVSDIVGWPLAAPELAPVLRRLLAAPLGPTMDHRAPHTGPAASAH